MLCSGEGVDAHNDKALRQKFSSALMSNNKWHKLFLVMADYGSDFDGIEYRFTDTDKVWSGKAPLPQQVWRTGVKDPLHGACGLIHYKHIESIFIPFKYSYRPYEKAAFHERPLDVDSFVRALNSVGKFPITETEGGIIIHGYKA